METLYFTLGIASVVVTVVTVGAVWAMFKVAKLSSALRHELGQVDQAIIETHRRMDDISRDAHHRIDRLSDTLDNAICESVSHCDERCDHITRTMDNVVSECIAHTDSRVDKLEDKLSKSKKQLIKG